MRIKYTQNLTAEFPDYTPVSRAPTLRDLEAIAENDEAEVSRLISLESAKRYSATNGHEVFIMQNPAVQSYQSSNFQTPVKRMPPQSIGRLNQTKKPSAYRGGGDRSPAWDRE